MDGWINGVKSKDMYNGQRAGKCPFPLSINIQIVWLDTAPTKANFLMYNIMPTNLGARWYRLFMKNQAIFFVFGR